jgi:hypothetical protein
MAVFEILFNRLQNNITGSKMEEAKFEQIIDKINSTTDPKVLRRIQKEMSKRTIKNDSKDNPMEIEIAKQLKSKIKSLKQKKSTQKKSQTESERLTKIPRTTQVNVITIVKPNYKANDT